MKIKAVVLALVFCVTLCSCGKSENDEVVLTDLIEAEASISEITETVSETEVVSETQTETSAETAEAAVQTTEFTEVVLEETVAEFAEYNDLEISEIYFSHIFGEDGRDVYYNISPCNSRVYVNNYGGYGIACSGWITDKTFYEIAEAVNQSGVSEYYGTDNIGSSTKFDIFRITVTDVNGTEYTAAYEGEGSNVFSSLEAVLYEYKQNAYYGEAPHYYAEIGIRKAVDAMVYFRSYLRKCSDLGEDCSEYAGQSMIIDSSNLNPLDSDMFYLPDDWSGYAFVKFNADGTDVEYVNWAETEDALSEEKLIYDDLEAYYIENEIIIGSTLEE